MWTFSNVLQVYSCVTLWGSNKRNVPDEWEDVIRDTGEAIPLAGDSQRYGSYQRIDGRDDSDGAHSDHSEGGRDNEGKREDEGSPLRGRYKQDVMGNIQMVSDWIS